MEDTLVCLPVAWPVRCWVPVLVCCLPAMPEEAASCGLIPKFCTHNKAQCASSLLTPSIELSPAAA